MQGWQFIRMGHKLIRDLISESWWRIPDARYRIPDEVKVKVRFRFRIRRRTLKLNGWMLEFPSLRGCVLNLTKREENHPVQTGGFSGVCKIDRQECLSYQARCRCLLWVYRKDQPMSHQHCWCTPKQKLHILFFLRSPVLPFVIIRSMGVVTIWRRNILEL